MQNRAGVRWWAGPSGPGRKGTPCVARSGDGGALWALRSLESVSHHRGGLPWAQASGAAKQSAGTSLRAEGRRDALASGF